MSIDSRTVMAHLAQCASSVFANSDVERLWPGDEMRGVARQYEAKLRAMFTAIEEAQNVAELARPPAGRVLKARRKGIWSLTVHKQSSADFPDRRSVVSEIDFKD